MYTVLKYHFIKQRFHTGAKIHDFGYWGTSKKKKVGGGLSGDVRHEVLKDLHKSDLKTLFIGNFDGFQRDRTFALLSTVCKMAFWRIWHDHRTGKKT